jgi:pimeloyl-ACP methyl ester carboxylesterase
MRRIESRDGVALTLETRGEPDRPGIVFAHGFGQTRRAWASSAAMLAELGYFAVTFDARGHGDSGWRTDKPYDWEQMRDDLLAIVGTLPSPPVLVGASMGGLVGLAAEGMEGPLFRALVMVDVTPRWEPRGVDRILNFMRAYPHGFDSFDEAAQAIVAYLPHRGGRKSPERLRALLEDRGDGRLRWHWDPRLLDELARGSESQQPLLLEAARRIRIPTLLISGGASDVVSPATIDEFLSLVPHARHVVVPHATHMVAGDDNIVFTQHVVQFLGTLRDKESES